MQPAGFIEIHDPVLAPIKPASYKNKLLAAQGMKGMSHRKALDRLID